VQTVHSVMSKHEINHHAHHPIRIKYEKTNNQSNRLIFKVQYIYLHQWRIQGLILEEGGTKVQKVPKLATHSVKQRKTNPLHPLDPEHYIQTTDETI